MTLCCPSTDHSRAATPATLNATLGTTPNRATTVVPPPTSTAPVKTHRVNRVDWARTEPSGSTTADRPLVAATTTVRSNSIARRRLMANCCGLSSEYPKVALLVWTTNNCAPPRITSATRPS